MGGYGSGRKRLHPADKRTHKMSVAMTPTEYGRVVAEAKRRNITMTEVLRTGGVPPA